jgi:hypothetical protein
MKKVYCKCEKLGFSKKKKEKKEKKESSKMLTITPKKNREKNKF